MMIKKIYINNFRNIEQSTLEFGNNFNILYGDNGHGKTNIIESIFLIATLKSFRHAKNIEMIKWNKHTAIIRGTVTNDKMQHELFLSMEAHKKQVEVDSKTPSRLIDYCNIVPVVAFSPEELGMVDGTPEQRRRYLDRAIFSSNADYLKIYHDYFRTLKQRNQLLRNQNYSALEAWTDQLVVTGTKLIVARKNYIEELAVLFKLFYGTISGSDEVGCLCYHPNSLPESASPEEIGRKLQSAIADNFRIERDRGTTLNGPHRDDLKFFLTNKPICLHGSQGQKKSFVLSMKMAEIECLQRKRGISPILLLDDMTVELDKNRVKHLLDFLVTRKMQVFVTTTDKSTVPINESMSCSFFHIESGRLVK